MSIMPKGKSYRKTVLRRGCRRQPARSGAGRFREKSTTKAGEMAGLEASLTYTSLELRAAAMEGFDMEACKGCQDKDLPALGSGKRRPEVPLEADLPRGRQLRRRGTWNPRNCLDFQCVRPGNDRKGGLRENWNSVISWLREVLVWSQPAGAESHQRP